MASGRAMQAHVFVFALQFGPTPLEDILDPRRELDAKLLVERTEEAQDLDNFERRLPIEVDRLKLSDDTVHDWLQPTRIFVVEDMLQRSQHKLVLERYAP